MNGPSILAVVAIVFVAGAAVVLWRVGDRNAGRGHDANGAGNDEGTDRSPSP